METTISVNGEALLLKMRALSRRGASLRRLDDGNGSIEQLEKTRQARSVTPQEFVGMLDAGWLRPEGADAFVMSRRGALALKGMLNRQTARAAIGTAKVTAASPPRSTHRAAAKPIKPILNSRESPIAWLRQHKGPNGRPLLSEAEYEAGERLRRDFERSHLAQRVTASWDLSSIPSGNSRGAPGQGLDIADTAIAARQRVEQAMAAVGPQMAGMLLDVCCYLKGLEQAERNGDWPRRSGKVVLQLGLAHLARHYGFAGPAGPREGTVRSWGTADYRPAFDAPEESEP